MHKGALNVDSIKVNFEYGVQGNFSHVDEVWWYVGDFGDFKDILNFFGLKGNLDISMKFKVI